MEENIIEQEGIAVPLELLADSRLTLEAMRVLFVLYSLANEDGVLVFPGREEISTRSAGMHPSNVSAATKKLVELGWLTKDKEIYTLTVPAVATEIMESNKARVAAWKGAMKRPRIPANIRRMVFERDAYRCVKCSSYTRLCVDHRHPFSLGGSSEPDNLQTLCWDCNSKKGNKLEVVE